MGRGESESCLEALAQQLVRKLPASGKAGKGSRTQGSAATGMVIVVLEEMDALVTADQSILYELFQLPQVQIHTFCPMSC